ncbi:MAG: hypothetical protein JO332_01325 [Planctomycetaceae bacterium]|nr:hypothetical protein [Planctomycetaceae bacterium]
MPNDMEAPLDAPPVQTPKGLLKRLRHILRPPRDILTLEDPMSQTTFTAVREGPPASILAVATFVYLVSATLFALWELVDIWSGRHRLMTWLGFDPAFCAASATFRQMAFVAAGGFLGSALSGIRSLIFWHCIHKAFEPRFFWKYATGPLSGAALALLVQVLIRAGTSMLGADSGGSGGGARQSMMMFAIGMLSGYGAEQVTRWLDDQVKRIFRPTGEPVVRRVTPAGAKDRPEPDPAPVTTLRSYRPE